MDKRPAIILEVFSRTPYTLPKSRGITLFVDGTPTFEAHFSDWSSMEQLALTMAKMSDPEARVVFTTECLPPYSRWADPGVDDFYGALVCKNPGGLARISF